MTKIKQKQKEQKAKKIFRASLKAFVFKKKKKYVEVKIMILKQEETLKENK